MRSSDEEDATQRASRQRVEEMPKPLGFRQFLREELLGFGPDVVMRVVGELMPGQFPYLHQYVGLLHADALRDDAGADAAHAVLFVDTLIGFRRQRLAVDEHAVAIEDDQFTCHGKMPQVLVMH